MSSLGILISVSGFFGVLSIGILGLTKNFPLAVSAQLMGTLAFFIYSVRASGSIKAWFNMQIQSRYSISPLYVTFACQIFVFMGVYSMLFGEPSNGPDSMNRNEIIYFSSVILLIGLGLTLVSFNDYLKSKN